MKSWYCVNSSTNEAVSLQMPSNGISAPLCMKTFPLICLRSDDNHVLVKACHSSVITSCLAPPWVKHSYSVPPTSLSLMYSIYSAARASGGHEADAALSFQAFSVLLSLLVLLSLMLLTGQALCAVPVPVCVKLKVSVWIVRQLFSLFWCGQGRGPINPEGMLSPGRQKGHSPQGEEVERSSLIKISHPPYFCCKMSLSEPGQVAITPFISPLIRSPAIQCLPVLRCFKALAFGSLSNRLYFLRLCLLCMVGCFYPLPVSCSADWIYQKWHLQSF